MCRWLAAAVAGLAGQLGCTGEPPATGSPAAPNLLLIVMDTLRGDHLGCYGGPAETPYLDRLASRGVLFESAYAHAASTGPSHASLLTSLLPFEHGVRANRQSLADRHTTLAETLQQAGWSTSAVVSLGVLQGKFGFEQGFDVYRDDFSSDWLRNAREVTDEARDVMASNPAEPFFLWAHYCDPHAPYAPGDLDYPTVDLELDGVPVGAIEADGRRFATELSLAPGLNRLRFSAADPEVDRRFQIDVPRVTDDSVALEPGDWTLVEQRRRAPSLLARLPATLELIAGPEVADPVEFRFNCKEDLSLDEIRTRYAMEAEYADRHIGVLLRDLEQRGLLENTLVIFTSDHGEGLGDHDHVTHVQQLYDTLIRVPLIVSFPGRIQEGLRVDDLVSLSDVYPTVTELFGLPAPDPATGSSLVPLLEGRTMAERPVFAETSRPEARVDKKAVVSDGFKYIRSWERDGVVEELYHLDSDPDELRDLLPERTETAERLRTMLAERLESRPPAEVAEVELTEDEADRLKALGYVH